MTIVRAAMVGATFFALGSSAVLAATPNVEKPMLNHVEDAALQPAKDVNLRKDKIPVRLLEIQRSPYDLTGMQDCQRISTEISNLDPLLGPDVNIDPNLSRAEKRERGVSRIAGGILGGFIPFRGVVREVTGANAAQQRYQRAMAAGFARRSFLKGIAMGRGCQKRELVNILPDSMLNWQP